MSEGPERAIGRHTLEVYASACGGGISTSETSVNVIDLLPPRTLRAIRERVAFRVLEALRQREERVYEPTHQVRHAVTSNVYLMRSNGLFKIGISRSIEARRAQLSTASGYAVDVVAYWPMDAQKAAEVERALHEHFADKRMNGEWFALHKDDIETIVIMVGGLP